MEQRWVRLRAMPAKAPLWVPLVAAWLEECADEGKEKRINKRNNKGSCKHINALLAPVWTRAVTA